MRTTPSPDQEQKAKLIVSNVNRMMEELSDKYPKLPVSGRLGNLSNSKAGDKFISVFHKPKHQIPLNDLAHEMSLINMMNNSVSSLEKRIIKLAEYIESSVSAFQRKHKLHSPEEVIKVFNKEPEQHHATRALLLILKEAHDTATAEGVELKSFDKLTEGVLKICKNIKNPGITLDNPKLKDFYASFESPTRKIETPTFQHR